MPLLGAISVAELGAMIPRSGGWYVFIHRAMGNYPGFVVGWSDWLSTCGTLGVIALRRRRILCGSDSPLAGRDKAIAVAVVLLFCGPAVARHLRWGSFTQNLTSAIKTLNLRGDRDRALSRLPEQANLGNRTGARRRDLRSLPRSSLRLQGVLYTYDGWYGVIYFGEEVRNPKRDVVRSMFGGVLVGRGHLPGGESRLCSRPADVSTRERKPAGGRGGASPFRKLWR